MKILKLTNGKLELRKDTGTLIRTLVSSGVIDADLNSSQTLVLVVTDKGKVELRKETGTLIRTITSSGAKGGKFNGENLVISLTSGKTELRKESGSLIRTL